MMLPRLLFFTVILASLVSSPLLARDIKYQDFFSHKENFYLLQPTLIADFFTGLIETKGKGNRAKRNIARNILGCPVGMTATSNCPVDRYKLLKKEKRTPSTFIAQVNWTVVERVKKGRFHVLSLTWRPELIDTEIFLIEDYLKSLKVAAESKDFRVPSQIKRVQFSPHFQRRIQIKVDAKMAKVLLELYDDKPSDFRDSITFIAEGNSVTLRDDLATFNLFLKAKKVQINHLTFPAMLVPQATRRNGGRK